LGEPHSSSLKRPVKDVRLKKNPSQAALHVQSPDEKNKGMPEEVSSYKETKGKRREKAVLVFS